MKASGARRVCATCVIVLTGIILAEGVNANPFYIAPDGDDVNPGTEAAPWATIEQARDHIRTINGNMSADITIYLREGTYSQTSPITFTELDSGSNGHEILYRNYPGETPLISGGVPVTNWTQHAGDIYKATLNRSTKLRQLYVNERRKIMAKSDAIIPEGGWGTFNISGTEPWALGSGSTVAGIQFDTADFGDYDRPEDIELTQNQIWSDQRLTIADITMEAGKRIAHFQMPAAAFSLNRKWVALNPNGVTENWWLDPVTYSTNYVVVHNALELLDEPEEFYFDKDSQTLYYHAWPGQNLNNIETIAPMSEGLLIIQGSSTSSRVEHLAFEGLQFAYAHYGLLDIAGSKAASGAQSIALDVKFHPDGNMHEAHYDTTDLQPAAIQVNNSRYIRFEDNTIAHNGAVGIGFYNDVKNSEVIGNAFFDNGSSGFSVGHPQHHEIGDGRPHSAFTPATEGLCEFITVANNAIWSCSQEHIQAPVLSAFFVKDTEFLHNDVHDCAYSGISFGWGWGSAKEYFGGPDPSSVMANNKVNNNRVHEFMQILKDGAGIYTLGDNPNSEVRGNFLSNSIGGYTAMYPDEGSGWWQWLENVNESPMFATFFVNGPGSHDMLFDEIYTTRPTGWQGYVISDNRNTNITVQDLYKDDYFVDGKWPPAGEAIKANAGIEPAYASVMSKIPSTVNHARGKTSTQSSIAFNQPPENANDGSTVSSYPNISITFKENEPWWQVDLGKVENIHEMIIWERSGGGNMDSLTDAYVFISDNPITSGESTATLLARSDVQSFQLPDFSANIKIPVYDSARYIQVMIPRNDTLEMSEVEVLEYAPILNAPDFPADFHTDPIAPGAAKENVPYSASLVPYAEELSGSIPSFGRLASGPTWLSVTSEGLLTGTPQSSDSGLNTWTVWVTDANGITNTATLNIDVEVYIPPSFTVSTISAPDASQDTPYSVDLKNYAQNTSPSDSVFSLLPGGPSWLFVAANGSVTGTPGLGDVGQNTWTVQVAGPAGEPDQATLEINVNPLVVDDPGVTYTWTGGAEDGSWNSVANWDANGVPVDQDEGTANLNGDMMIIFDGNTLPTSNTPIMQGGYYSLTRDTPSIKLERGTLALSFGGEGISKNSSEATCRVIEVGNGTDPAKLTIDADGRTDFGVNRHNSGNLNLIQVNKNAALEIIDSLHMSFNDTRDGQIWVAADAMLTVNGVIRFNGAANSFLAVGNGASVTAQFGGDFSDLAAVNAAFGGRFIGTQGAILSAVDNGDSTFTVSGELSGGVYEIWASSYSLAGADALHDADPDGDGIKNLAEFAFGGHPGASGDAVLPTHDMRIAGGSNVLEFVYLRRRDASQIGLDYQMLLCTNLVDNGWVDSGYISETGIETINADYETVTNEVPVLQSQAFIRLEIELTP